MKLADEIKSIKVDTGELAICWLGQAGFLLIDSRRRIAVLDPYLTECGERIRGFKRLSPILIKPEEIKPDYYITTHSHFDHFDYDAIPVIASNTEKTLFFGPDSCMTAYEEAGADKERCLRLNRGDSYTDGSIRIHALAADHGKMAPDAIGVVIEIEGHILYFTGDTSFQKAIISEAASFRPEVSIVSINGRFGNMNEREGALAAVMTGARAAIPCHFWTFAEHGGDPGVFCRELSEEKECRAVCFRQGEIKIISRNGELQQRR